MADYTDIIAALKTAPDSQLDAAGVALINQWSDPPSPEQILELLDKCICYSWSSGFVVTFLRTLLDMRMAEEKITYDAVVANATWRQTLLP